VLFTCVACVAFVVRMCVCVCFGVVEMCVCVLMYMYMVCVFVSGIVCSNGLLKTHTHILCGMKTNRYNTHKSSLDIFSLLSLPALCLY